MAGKQLAQIWYEKITPLSPNMYTVHKGNRRQQSSPVLLGEGAKRTFVTTRPVSPPPLFSETLRGLTVNSTTDRSVISSCNCCYVDVYCILHTVQQCSGGFRGARGLNLVLALHFVLSPLLLASPSTAEID